MAVAILRQPWEAVKDRPLRTLSGGEQKRFALQLLLQGRDEVLVLDEPDNFLDVPAKRELEQAIRDSDKSILFVSHDREVLANAASSIVTLEAGTTWTHGGGFATWHDARPARHERFEELRRRWDEEHHKLRELMLMYKNKAAYNSDMASRYRAAQTRLRKFEEAGPPPSPPRDQDIRVKLEGGRTGKRAVDLRAARTGGPDLPVRPRGLVRRPRRRPGRQRDRQEPLPAPARAGRLRPGGRARRQAAAWNRCGTTALARLGARVYPGHFSQTHEHPEFDGRTLREILWEGDEDRPSLDRSKAMSALNRYELTGQSEQDFKTLSGGQQARFMVLMLELSGATCLLLDEPTDNLDLASAEALEQGLKAFDGTVLAVTHDRWFTRGFDRFVVFQNDGEVIESNEPIWDVR